MDRQLIIDAEYEKVSAQMWEGASSVMIQATVPGKLGLSASVCEGATKLFLHVYDRATLAGLAQVCLEATQAIDGLVADGIEVLPDA